MYPRLPSVRCGTRAKIIWRLESNLGIKFLLSGFCGSRERMQNDKKLFLSGIAGKLAVLMGGAIAATGANASPFTAAVPHPETNTISSAGTPRDAGSEAHPEAAE